MTPITIADSITVPLRLANKLAQDKAIEGYVYQTLEIWMPWIAGSGMPFFPSFTDHGPKHLSRVLDTADWLITDMSLEILSPHDIAALILCVLLHDSAMHLTEDSFRALLEGQPSELHEFADVAWRELWNTYLLESKRWDKNMWESVLGPKAPGNFVGSSRIFVEGTLDDLRESDKRFIGEFLRRHHPRLAHEFALFGVPGPINNRLTLAAPPNLPHFSDIVGLVARSHGMSMRTTFAYLQNKHDGLRRLYGMLPIYLMGVLRIADYLDLYAERAPSTLLKVKNLRSVISDQEWKAHAAITDIRYGGSNDPERIEIIAMPDSARTYSSILRWVRGIQFELDQTWATFGEIYGSDSNFCRLELRIRRITSPIEDEKRFSDEKRLRFEPRMASFSVDSRNLLPLLAKPLYGDHPEVGVRELMQNSIDAVNELKFLISKGAIRQSVLDQLIPLPTETECDVLVSLCGRRYERHSIDEAIPEGWEYWIEVIDRGIGMTVDTIRNYFLSAGSSLRRNIAWMQSFSVNDKIRVIRSGRFGIGTIAAFALGDEIQVTTRYAADSVQGIRFTAKLDQNDIELQKVDAPIGTTIRVRLDEKTAKALGIECRATDSRWDSWDWYCLDLPRVQRVVKIGSEKFVCPQSTTVSIIDGCSPGWRRVHCDEFDTVLWRPNKSSHQHSLYCNGIRVFKGGYNFDKKLFSNVPELKQPDVLVIDPAGLLPLTISRDGLSGSPPYEDQVKRDALLDHCAWLINQAAIPVEKRKPFEAPMWQQEFGTHPGDGMIESSTYFVTNSGIVPATHWHLHATGTAYVCFYFSSNRSNIAGADFVTLPLRNKLWKAQLQCVFGKVKVELYGGFGYEPYAHVALRETHRLVAKLGCGRSKWGFFVPEFMAKELRGSSFVRSGEVLLELPQSDWSLYASSDLAAIEMLQMSRLIQDTGAYQSTNAAHGFGMFSIDPKSPDTDAFAQIWTELELPSIIPFDETARQMTCAKALQQLRPYLERYQAGIAS